MKKLLLLLAIPVFLFSCNSRDDSKTKTTAVDSTKIGPTKKSVSSQPPPDLSKYIISNDTAIAIMMNNPRFPHTPKYIDSSLKIELQNQNPSATIELINCKYRKEDQHRYCNTRNFPPGSDSSKVKNYKTVIYKLITQDASKAIVETYYDFVTLCPPPPQGCD